MATIGKKTSRLITNKRFGSTITLIKKSAGSYVDGLYVAGDDTLTEIVANHQPASQDDRQNLPENERLTEAKKVYVKSSDKNFVRPIRYGDNNSPGDQFLINGIYYEVYHVDNYSVENHIACIAVRIENQSD